jgi:hypothetical protein
MSHSQRLRQSDIRAALNLLSEVEALGIDPRAWRTHLLQNMARLIGARVGIACDLHNFLLNKPPIPIDNIDVGFDGDGERMQYVRYIQSDNRAVDPSSVALCTAMPHRRFITFRREQLVEDKLWYAAPITSESRRASNVDSFVCSLYRMPEPGRVTGFILYRNWREKGFSERTHRLIRLSHAELLKKIARSNGDELPPYLRHFLQCYLSGRGDKDTADYLGLSLHTVKSYAKTLYAKLGVSSRSELMAHYLNRPHRRPILMPAGF